MQNIDLVLDHARDHYLTGYTQRIAEYKKEFNPSSPEVLLEIGGREDQPLPYRLYRVDLASGAVEPPNLTEFNHDSHLSFKPIEFKIKNKLSGILNAISWNGVEFETICLDPNAKPLADWALKWIDIEESHTENQYGLGGYVHSITYPQKTREKCTFSVDFGSAGKESFYELMNVFIALEITELTVHSRTLHAAP
nr:hypothetical protein [uncultured Pseudomonas sp.]